MLIVMRQGMNTTAGSYSLLDSVVPNDAGVVKRLRKAGAIILGGYLDNADHHKTSDTQHYRQGKPV
jgi:amidase